MSKDAGFMGHFTGGDMGGGGADSGPGDELLNILAYLMFLG